VRAKFNNNNNAKLIKLYLTLKSWYSALRLEFSVITISRQTLKNEGLVFTFFLNPHSLLFSP